jgi:hypothetical protein
LHRFTYLTVSALSGKHFSRPYFAKAPALAARYDRLASAVHSSFLQKLPEFTDTRTTCAGHPFGWRRFATPGFNY